MLQHICIYMYNMNNNICVMYNNIIMYNNIYVTYVAYIYATTIYATYNILLEMVVQDNITL